MGSTAAQVTPMNRQELRVKVVSQWCGCGDPEEACRALHRLLRLHTLHYPDNFDGLREWLPDSGVRYLLLYWLDLLGLTEHGGSVDGAWLSELGRSVLMALDAEEADGYVDLNEQYCVHGYDVDDPTHDCFETDPPEAA